MTTFVGRTKELRALADECIQHLTGLEATEAPPEHGALREERLRGIAQPMAIATLT